MGTRPDKAEVRGLFQHSPVRSDDGFTYGVGVPCRAEEFAITAGRDRRPVPEVVFAGPSQFAESRLAKEHHLRVVKALGVAPALEMMLTMIEGVPGLLLERILWKGPRRITMHCLP